MRFYQSTHLLMTLSLETLTSIIRFGLPILVELIDWWTLLYLKEPYSEDNSPIQIPDYDSHSPALLDFFLSPDANICSTMLLSQFPLTFHQTHNGCSSHSLWLFSSWLGWSLWSFERDCLVGYLLKLVLLLLLNLVSGFRLELMYISLIENNRSSITHLHGFQPLVLLP